MAQQLQVPSLLIHFQKLFWLCKIFGIYPYDLTAFQRDHVLKKSKTGTWCVLLSMVLVIICYNLLIYSFAEEDRILKEKQSTLTFVIGLFLTYIGLVMMATDQLTSIKNQNKIGELYERIRVVDERLYKDGCVLDGAGIPNRITKMIISSLVFELAIFLSTFILLVDYSNWMSLCWIFSIFPTFFNSLDKIWFSVSLYALRLRFEAINGTLEEIVESHEKYKRSGDEEVDEGRFLKTLGSSQFENNMEYLYAEFGSLDALSLKGSAKNKVAPVPQPVKGFGETIDTPQKQINQKISMNMACTSEFTDIIKFEQKVNNLCQIHDEICEIGKLLNELWSYPILMLMAYGFLIFTAQLYFLYCATQDQAIPSLFRSAKSAIITTVYLSYTAGKCVYLIFLSWKTSLSSKRTGICLHKCGVVADNNVVYEIVNHLSLKLLNHSVDFSACGFFTLDMETLYGVCGGITSYLIILIQFNLAAQQAKDSIQTFTNFNQTANLIVGVDEIDNSTYTYDYFSSSTSITTTSTDGF